MKWFTWVAGLAIVLCGAIATTGPPKKVVPSSALCVDQQNLPIVNHVQPATAETIEEGVARISLADKVGALALKIWRDPTSGDATAFIMRTDPNASGASAMMALLVTLGRPTTTTANGEEGATTYHVIAS